jgi:hypothetical protein
MVFDFQSETRSRFLDGKQEMSTKQDFLLGSGPVQKFHDCDRVENISMPQGGDASVQAIGNALNGHGVAG